MAGERLITGGLLPAAGLECGVFLAAAAGYRAAPVVSAPALIPVRVEPAVSAGESVVLHWGQGQRLELSASMSPRWLAELLRCLG